MDFFNHMYCTAEAGEQFDNDNGINLAFRHGISLKTTVKTTQSSFKVGSPSFGLVRPRLNYSG